MKLLILAFSLIVFENSILSQDLDSPFIGNWSFEKIDSESNVQIFSSTKKIKTNTSGFQIQEGGMILYRTNSSGCSVTGVKNKIDLQDLEGNWNLLDNNQIKIEVASFAINYIYSAEIINGKLRLKLPE